MAKNGNLKNAKKAKNDEFYTQLTDIEKELRHYKEHFKDKIVFCNCDDPEWSNFWKYFKLNFEHLGLKKLISTHFNMDGSPSYALILENYGETETKIPLKENGDFRSEECIEFLKEADIVVTNPPFSLFREYVAQLMEYDKKFLILGNNNAITYKEFFPLLKENKVWLGYSANKTFIFQMSDDYILSGNGAYQDKETGKKYCKVPAITWYTNLDIHKRHEIIDLYKTYNPQEYPKYDNYDAINVDKVSDIPKDYEGVMGVPITFMDKYNPEQFEIIGEANHGSDSEYDLCKPTIKGKQVFKRLLIKRRCIYENRNEIN